MDDGTDTSKFIVLLLICALYVSMLTVAVNVLKAVSALTLPCLPIGDNTVIFTSSKVRSAKSPSKDSPAFVHLIFIKGQTSGSELVPLIISEAFDVTCSIT